MKTGEETRNCDLIFERLSSYLKCDAKIKRKADDCECLICQVAKATGFKADLVLKMCKMETSDNYNPPKVTQMAEKLCGKCLHPLHKGIRGHMCNQTILLKNISNLLPRSKKELPVILSNRKLKIQEMERWP